MKAAGKEKRLMAEKLFRSGQTSAEIARATGYSKRTISRWKKQAPLRGGAERPGEVFSPALWLDSQIERSMKEIDGAQGEREDTKALRGALDDFISMKKKYESSIDRYGETKRVMEDFIGYLKDEQEGGLPQLGGLIEAYVRYVGR